MYKCLIADDEKLARQLVQDHLSKLDQFEVIASCKNAIEATSILTQEHVDLLFLDIEMPVLRGTDFYKNLQNKPKVIFTTAYRDYALDGFELNAVDYLLKPITFPRFLQAIEKFMLTQKQQDSTPSSTDIREYVFVTEDRKQVKINFDDILYIESLKNYIKITTQLKTHIIKQGISSFEESLDDRFLRIHRSFIVNASKITAYTKHDVEIGSIELPIGEKYKSVIEQIR